MGYKVKRIYQGTNLVRPSGWTPGSNTIAYYPLTSSSTIYDQSGNGRTLTNSGTQFGTYGGIDCAYFQRTNTKKLYGTLPLTGNQNFTINVYIKRIGDSYISLNTGSQIFVLGNIGSSGGCLGTAIVNGNSGDTYPNRYKNYTRGNDKTSSYTNTLNVRRLITVTNNGGNIKMYENGVLINDNSISFSVNSTNFTVGSFPSGAGGNTDYQGYYGYMSEIIVENKTRTDAEILNYYNKTKSNYGL